MTKMTFKQFGAVLSGLTILAVAGAGAKHDSTPAALVDARLDLPQDRSTLPASLTNAFFGLPRRGDGQSPWHTIVTEVTTFNPKFFTTTVYRTPVLQNLTLRFNTSNGYFAAPIIVSDNPLVKAPDSGKAATQYLRTRTNYETVLRVDSPPPNPVTVEIKAIWGRATKHVFWTLTPAPTPPPYIQSMNVTSGNPRPGGVVSFDIDLVQPAGANGETIFWSMTPAQAFVQIPGEASYDPSVNRNRLTVPSGRSTAQIKLQVVSSWRTATAAYIKTWIRDQNATAAPAYYERMFKIIWP